MSRAALLALLFVLPWPVSGQTAENLRRAIDLYENLQIEQARGLFLQIISPNSPFEVSPAERVTAYLYLGAAYASLQSADSAVTFFRAAIERDPFVDLDPERFTEIERQAFAEARQRSFRVGIRSDLTPEGRELDPRAESITLDALTTHDGTMRVEINHTQRPLRFPIFEGPNAGLRELDWSGTLPQGGVVPEGTYEILVTGLSLVNQRIDSARVLVNVDHLLSGDLEDTLPSFTRAELLPERHAGSVARREFLMGIGVAAGALIIPVVLSDASLGNTGALSYSVAGLGVITGFAAYFNRQSNPVIEENVRENLRRQQARLTENEAIRRRNADRIANTTLRLAAATGVR